MGPSAASEGHSAKKRTASRAKTKSAPATSSRRPPKRVEDGYVYYASEEDMKDLGKLIHKLHEKCVEYGALQVVPPSKWNHPPLRMRKDTPFHRRKQLVPADPLTGARISDVDPFELAPRVNVVDYLEYAEKALGQVDFNPDPSTHPSKFGKPLAKEDLGPIIENEKKFFTMMELGLPKRVNGEDGEKTTVYVKGALFYGVDVEAEGAYDPTDGTYFGYNANQSGYKEVDCTQPFLELSTFPNLKATADAKGATRKTNTDSRASRFSAEQESSTPVVLATQSSHNECPITTAEPSRTTSQPLPRTNIAYAQTQINRAPQIAQPLSHDHNTQPHVLQSATVQDPACVSIISVQNDTLLRTSESVEGTTAITTVPANPAVAVPRMHGAPLNGVHSSLPPSSRTVRMGAEVQGETRTHDRTDRDLEYPAHATHTSQLRFSASLQSKLAPDSSGNERTVQPTAFQNLSTLAPPNKSSPSLALVQSGIMVPRKESYRIGSILPVGSSHSVALAPVVAHPELGRAQGTVFQSAASGDVRPSHSTSIAYIPRPANEPSLLSPIPQTLVHPNANPTSTLEFPRARSSAHALPTQEWVAVADFPNQPSYACGMYGQQVSLPAMLHSATVPEKTFNQDTNRLASVQVKPVNHPVHTSGRACNLLNSSVAPVIGTDNESAANVEEEVLDCSGIDPIPNDIGSPDEHKAFNGASEEEEVIEEGGPEEVCVEKSSPVSSVPEMPVSHVGNINEKGCLRHSPASPGINRPMFYVGAAGTRFSFHTEDMNLNSISYMHRGSAVKVWYSIPSDQAELLEEYCAESVFTKSAVKNNGIMMKLAGKTTMLNPHHMAAFGIEVYRHVQTPGTFVITAPRGYHGGFNNGFNIAEAVNYANPNWFPFGRIAAEKYREAKTQPAIPVEFIVFQDANSMYKEVQEKGLAEVRKDPVKVSNAKHIAEALEQYVIEGERKFRAYRDKCRAAISNVFELNTNGCSYEALEWSFGRGAGVPCTLCKCMAHFYFSVCGSCTEKKVRLCLEHFGQRAICRKKGHKPILVRRHDPMFLRAMLKTIEQVGGIEKSAEVYLKRYEDIAQFWNREQQKQEPSGRRIQFNFSMASVQRQERDPADEDDKASENSQNKKKRKRKQTAKDEDFIVDGDDDVSVDADEDMDEDESDAEDDEYLPSQLAVKLAARAKKMLKRESDKAVPDGAKKVKLSPAKKHRSKSKRVEQVGDSVQPVATSPSLQGKGASRRKSRVRVLEISPSLKEEQRIMQALPNGAVKAENSNGDTVAMMKLSKDKETPVVLNLVSSLNRTPSSVKKEQIDAESDSVGGSGSYAGEEDAAVMDLLAKRKPENEDRFSFSRPSKRPKTENGWKQKSPNPDAHDSLVGSTKTRKSSRQPAPKKMDPDFLCGSEFVKATIARPLAQKQKEHDNNIGIATIAQSKTKQDPPTEMIRDSAVDLGNTDDVVQNGMTQSAADERERRNHGLEDGVDQDKSQLDGNKELALGCENFDVAPVGDAEPAVQNQADAESKFHASMETSITDDEEDHSDAEKADMQQKSWQPASGRSIGSVHDGETTKVGHAAPAM